MEKKKKKNVGRGAGQFYATSEGGSDQSALNSTIQRGECDVTSRKPKKKKKEIALLLAKREKDRGGGKGEGRFGFSRSEARREGGRGSNSLLREGGGGKGKRTVFEGKKNDVKFIFILHFLAKKGREGVSFIYRGNTLDGKRRWPRCRFCSRLEEGEGKENQLNCSSRWAERGVFGEKGRGAGVMAIVLKERKGGRGREMLFDAVGRGGGGRGEKGSLGERCRNVQFTISWDS